MNIDLSKIVNGYISPKLDDYINAGNIDEKLAPKNIDDFGFPMGYLDLIDYSRDVERKFSDSIRYAVPFFNEFKDFFSYVTKHNLKDYVPFTYYGEILKIEEHGTGLYEFIINNEKELLELVTHVPGGFDNTYIDSYKESLLRLVRNFRLTFAIKNIEDTDCVFGVRDNEIFIRYKDFSNYNVLEGLRNSKTGFLGDLVKEFPSILEYGAVKQRFYADYSEIIVDTRSNCDGSYDEMFINCTLDNVHLIKLYLMNCAYKLNVEDTYNMSLIEALFDNLVYHNYETKPFKVIITDKGFVDFELIDEIENINPNDNGKASVFA